MREINNLDAGPLWLQRRMAEFRLSQLGAPHPVALARNRKISMRSMSLDAGMQNSTKSWASLSLDSC
jgi:hypothetical protein